MLDYPHKIKLANVSDEVDPDKGGAITATTERTLYKGSADMQEMKERVFLESDVPVGKQVVEGYLPESLPDDMSTSTVVYWQGRKGEVTELSQVDDSFTAIFDR